MANLFAFRKTADRVLHPVVSGLAKLPIHANAWTLLGAAIGLVGGVVLFYGQWWLGFALLLGRGSRSWTTSTIARAPTRSSGASR